MGSSSKARVIGIVVALGAGSGGCSSSAENMEDTGATSEALAVTATFDATLRVPKCATASSSCDSGVLTRGRGPLGPELNAPNTLQGTCADGTAGTFHMDESADSIRIATTDGTNLAPGKGVNVTATVWAWSGYAERPTGPLLHVRRHGAVAGLGSLSAR